MRRKLRCTILGLFIALATSGCAEMNHLLTALDADPRLQALGPGAVFPTIEDAAVDALTYTYLRASEENDTEHMRAGTIYSVGTGYSYGEIHTARNMLTEQLSYSLKRQDVARFHMYPRLTINTQRGPRNEKISRADRRSVNVTDPRHRPLFILHPSLEIREYRGKNYQTLDVADLRHWTPGTLVALHSH
jgi:hypothetical protein